MAFTGPETSLGHGQDCECDRPALVIDYLRGKSGDSIVRKSPHLNFIKLMVAQKEGRRCSP
jgi:hypothetical protein